MKNQKNYAQGERASFHGSVGWSRYKLMQYNGGRIELKPWGWNSIKLGSRIKN